MAYTSLLSTIDSVIKTNGANSITGADHQGVLHSVVSSLGNGYRYIGIATTTTDPGSPDDNQFYITATQGTYTHFSGVTVNDGEIAILAGTGTTWTKATINPDTLILKDTAPTTLSDPAPNYTLFGTYGGKNWSKDATGNIEWMATETLVTALSSTVDDEFKYQAQADGIEANFRADVITDSGSYYPNIGANEIRQLISNGLYKKTNLILTPAGAKAGTGAGDGTLYSIKGSDFTVARNSTRSRVDENGYIRQVAADEAAIDYTDDLAAISLEPQSTNKILYPFAVDNAYWTKTGLTVDDNGGAYYASPFKDSSGNIELVGRKLVEDGSTGGHKILKSMASLTDAGTYALSEIFKYNGRNVKVNIEDGTNVATATFDLENGVVLSGSGTINELADGYYALAVTDTFPAGNTTADVVAYLVDASENDSYTGDGTSGVYIAGIQLEEQAAATSFINDPTAAEGSETTRIAEEVSLDDDALLNFKNDGISIVAKVTFNDITNEAPIYYRQIDGSNGSALIYNYGGSSNSLSFWAYSDYGTNGYWAQLAMAWTPTVGQEYTIVITVDNDNSRGHIYIDGVDMTLTNNNINQYDFSITKTLTLAGNGAVANSLKVSNFMIINKELTSTEVSNLN